jgi:hypothetical protein
MADDLEDDEVFDEEDLAEGFDGEDLEEDVLEDGADVLGEGDEIVDDVEDEADEVVAEPEAALAPVDDEDDLTLDQDVELALDEVLAETMRLTTEPDDDDDAPVDVEDKTEAAESVLPKQDDEFRCSSCRLLKKVSQLADPAKNLCRDCV